MRYLDGLPGELRDRSSREPMHDLVQNASVIRSLKAIGYELDVIAGTAQLRWHPEADRCECDYPWIGLFESQVILRSPLHVFPWHDLQHRLHRTHAVGTFDGLEAYQPEGPPRLLLAHVMLPHAPFVVGPDGEPRSPDRMFSFAEGPLWEGTGEEYRQGYADQTRYTVRRSVAIAERLIETARSSGRSAIVILHGDHGPRAPVNGGRVPFDADELFPVFLAIRGAGALPEIETTRVSTLVNLYRVILSEYFGADLRPLPNESFMSSFGRPYDFKSVDLRGLQ